MLLLKLKKQKKQNPEEDLAISSSKEHTIAEDLKQSTTKASSIDFSGINAGPAVRKIARELEIDLKKINGTGKNAMITKEDLKNYIHTSTSSIPSYVSLDSLKDFGEFEIEQQSKIRKLGAKNLTNLGHLSHMLRILKK